MLKKLGFLTLACATLFGCAEFAETQQESAEQTLASPSLDEVMPRLKMPKSIIVCRAKQCAPAKLSTSKEYIYNTLLHMLDSNARQKAPICAANPNTHSCTEEFVSLPVTIGVTPAYMYLDDVKITDVSISQQNTMALNLLLNWGVSYNGQTPNCKPSKTLLYAKNVDNVIMEDNGYTCKMTTIGNTSVKTLFAIDYIDIDYGYIGGFYSIGLSGPAYGGSSGYMIIRLPRDVTIEATDFEYKPEPKIEVEVEVEEEIVNEPKEKPAAEAKSEATDKAPKKVEVKPLPQAKVPAAKPESEPIAAAPTPTPTPMHSNALVMPLPTNGVPVVPVAANPVQYAAPVAMPIAANPAPCPEEMAMPIAANPVQYTAPTAVPAAAPAAVPAAQTATEPRTPAPNVNTVIHYNHPARTYDTAKAKVVERQKLEKKGVEYDGIKVYPLPAKNVDKTAIEPTLKNSLSEYAKKASAE